MTYAKAIAAAFVFASCSANPRLEAVFAAHDASFVAQNGPVEHLVPRGEFRLAAREYGREHRAEGGPPTIVLMHGLPDSMHLYDSVVPELQNERHVVTFDFLGWGDSDHPREHTYDFRSLDTDLAAVIDYFDLRRYTLVAHDISGPAALDRALHDPRMASLVLLNTVDHRSELATRPEAVETFSGTGLKRSLLVFGIRWSDSRWQAGMRTQLRRFMVRDDEVEELYLDVFAHQALGIRPAFIGLNTFLRAEFLERMKSKQRLGRIEVPTYIVFGADDPYLTAELARELGDQIPGAAVQIVSDAGHYVQIDKPHEVAAAILGASASNL